MPVSPALKEALLSINPLMTDDEIETQFGNPGAESATDFTAQTQDYTPTLENNMLLPASGPAEDAVPLPQPAAPAPQAVPLPAQPAQPAQPVAPGASGLVAGDDYDSIMKGIDAEREAQRVPSWVKAFQKGFAVNMPGEARRQWEQDEIAKEKRLDEETRAKKKDFRDTQEWKLSVEKHKAEKEELNRKVAMAKNEEDPNSVVSKEAQKFARTVQSALPANHPGRLSDVELETMSAATIKRHLPMLEKHIDNVQKQLDGEQKRELELLKIKNAQLEVQQRREDRQADREQRAADRAADRALRRDIAGDRAAGKGGMTEAQAGNLSVKAEKEISDEQTKVDAANTGLSTVTSLEKLYKRTSTGPIVGSKAGMAVRGLLSSDVQNIQNAEANLTAAVAKTFGANPSNNETAILERLSRLSSMDPPARDAALAEAKKAMEAKKKTAETAVAGLRRTKEVADRTLYGQSAPTSAPAGRATRVVGGVTYTEVSPGQWEAQ